MSDSSTLQQETIKWPEIFSLAGLSAAVAISWIAYHEYQPHLLVAFGFEDLSTFLIIAKGIVLIIIPPFAGWLADKIMKKSGKLFIVLTVGISTTAMIFMVVASFISIGPLSQIKPFLPIMIVFWLIGMNLFVSPAISMIDSFAPTKKLPLVVGVLFLVTEMIYALEPLVIELVQFFGATLTFIVGGVLIAGTGYVFQKVSSDEVSARRDALNNDAVTSGVSSMGYILLIGFVLGIGKGFLVEYVPVKVETDFAGVSSLANYISFGLLGLSAIFAFLLSGKVAKVGFEKILPYSLVTLVIVIGILTQVSSFGIFIVVGVLAAIAFSMVNVCALPYVISKVSVRNITYMVGLFLGTSEIVGGILEYLYR